MAETRKGHLELFKDLSTASNPHHNPNFPDFVGTTNSGQTIEVFLGRMPVVRNGQAELAIDESLSRLEVRYPGEVARICIGIFGDMGKLAIAGCVEGISTHEVDSDDSANASNTIKHILHSAATL